MELWLCTTQEASNLEIFTKDLSQRNPSELTATKAELDQIAKRAPNSALEKAYDAWLSLPDIDRESLLQKVKLIPSQSNLTEIRDLLNTRLAIRGIREEAIESSRIFLIGWFEDLVDSRLESGICEVRLEEVVEILIEIQERIKPAVLASIASDEPVDDTIHEEDYSRPYLIQLTILDANSDDLQHAKSMYLKARKDRDYWMQTSIAGKREIDQYQDDMKNRWQGIRTRQLRIQSTDSLSDLTCGWNIHDSCMDALGKINGVPPQYHFHCGTCHMLANSPLPVPNIGWHPSYDQVLPTMIEEEKSDDS